MHVFSNRSSIVTVRSLPLFIVTCSVRTNHDADEEEDEDDVLRRSSRDKTIGPTFSSSPDAVKDDDGFDVVAFVSVSEPIVVVSDEVSSFLATETSPTSSSPSFTLSPLASPRRRRLCPIDDDERRRRPRLHRPRRSTNASRRSRSDDSTDLD